MYQCVWSWSVLTSTSASAVGMFSIWGFETFTIGVFFPFDVSLGIHHLLDRILTFLCISEPCSYYLWLPILA